MAGSRHASTPIAASKITAEMKMRGSNGVVSKRNCERARVESNESATPRATPAATNDHPWRSTMRSTFCLLAPIAMRMPNSRVRCSVTYETTP